MISQEKLKDLLTYDPETGIFTWNISPRYGIENGTVAGSLDALGYVIIVIKRKQYKAHRLAWLYMTGSFPEIHIDHINREKDDNRFSNLRKANPSENNWNVGIRKDNKSGYKGVCFIPEMNKFMVQIAVNNVQHYLGCFDDAEVAASVYQEHAKKFHGEFCHE